MSIRIEELKVMDENECNLWGRGAFCGTRLVIKFLKENNTEAYNIQEIKENINVYIKEDKRKIKKGSMYHIMRKLTLNENSNIRKKGSYYYYEEK